jgi:arylsulfatase A-like enzyme
VLADHGFSTDIGTFHLDDILAELTASHPIKTVSNDQIILPEHDPELFANIVGTLQQNRNVGTVCTTGTRETHPEGTVPGTFSTDLVNVTHDRCADILVDATWSPQPNSHKYQGITTRPGVGGHGTLSPYEMQVNLIAAGPNIKNTESPSQIPTAHVDIAPTLLSLHGITPPDCIDGRVLSELLITGKNAPEISVITKDYTTKNTNNQMYTATLKTATIDGTEFPLHGDAHRE